MSLLTRYKNLATTGVTDSNITTVITTANIGTDNNLTISGGLNGYVLQTDGRGNLIWSNPRGTVDPNTIPATQLMFNNLGSFNGSSNLTYDDSTRTLNVQGSINTENLSVISDNKIFPGLPNISGGYPNQVIVTDGAGNLNWAFVGGFGGTNLVKFTNTGQTVTAVIPSGANSFTSTGNLASELVANSLVSFSDGTTKIFRVANSVYNSGNNTTTVNTVDPILTGFNSNAYINSVTAPAGTNTLNINGQYLDVFTPGTGIFLTNEPVGQPLIVDNSYIDYQNSGFVTATQTLAGSLSVQGNVVLNFVSGSQVFISQPSGQIYTITATGTYNSDSNITTFQTSPTVPATSAGQQIYFARSRTVVTLTANLTVTIPSTTNVYTAPPVPAANPVYLVTLEPFFRMQFSNNVKSVNFAPKLGVEYLSNQVVAGGVIYNGGGLITSNSQFTFSDANTLTAPIFTTNTINSNTINVGPNGRILLTRLNSRNTPGDNVNINSSLSVISPAYVANPLPSSPNYFEVIEGTSVPPVYTNGNQYCLAGTPGEQRIEANTDTKINIGTAINNGRINTIQGLVWDNTNLGWVNTTNDWMVLNATYHVFWWMGPGSVINHDVNSRATWLSLNGRNDFDRYGMDDRSVNYWNFTGSGANARGASISQTGGAIIVLRPSDRLELWCWHNNVLAQPWHRAVGGGDRYLNDFTLEYQTGYTYTSAQQQQTKIVTDGLSTRLELVRLDN